MFRLFLKPLKQLEKNGLAVKWWNLNSDDCIIDTQKTELWKCTKLYQYATKAMKGHGDFQKKP